MAYVQFLHNTYFQYLNIAYHRPLNKEILELTFLISSHRSFDLLVGLLKPIINVAWQASGKISLIN